MEKKTSRMCVICRQIKATQYFPKIARKGRLLEQANICIACRAASLTNVSQDDSDDSDGGGGGKQLQHARDAKQLQYEIELAAALQKKLTNQNNLTHFKDIFEISQTLENEKKKQTAQRELLDRKEKSIDALEDDEPNLELTFDTRTKRERTTHLFSVTRSLTGNSVATNNAKANTQKNFGIFSQLKQQRINAQAENIKKANINKALSKESSTLFAQSHAVKEPATTEAEKLANAIREGQKIFNR